MIPFHKKETSIWGLSYRPTTEPEISDDDDHASDIKKRAQGKEFSQCNRDVLLAQMHDGLKCILEIGVNKYPMGVSSTGVILDNKPKGCVYLGIDILDKSHLDNAEDNIFTLQTNSSDHKKVIDRLKELGHRRIDLLMIDGWHSINAVVNDWQYTQWLSDAAVVVAHDTNAHTGPTLLFDAVDESLFDKKRHCTAKNKGVFADWGIAVYKPR